MNRFVSVTALLVAILTTSARAQQPSISQTESPRASDTDSNSSSAASRDLRSWSIPNAGNIASKIMNLSSSPSERVFECCTGLGVHRPRISVIPLSRCGESTSVAVVLVQNKRRVPALLNPRLRPQIAFDYGSIPELKDLTPEDADQVWGSGCGYVTATGRSRYELISPSGARYLFDLCFSDNHLKKYRISGPEIHTTSWAAVKESRIMLPSDIVDPALEPVVKK